MKSLLTLIIASITWTAFGQQLYTLEDYINEVLQNDFGLKIVRNESGIASNNNNIGAAGYLPQISLTGQRDLTINTARLEFITGDVNEAANAENASLGLGGFLEWTFFDGFKMFATDKKLNYLEEVAVLNLRAEAEMKVYQASMAFYSLLLLKEMQAVYEESIQLSKARLDYVEKRLKNGAATQVDQLQAQLDLTADSAIYLNNQREIDELKTTMNTLIAQPSNYSFDVQGTLPEQINQLPWEELVQRAKAQNTSLLIAKSNIAIREKEEKEIKSRYYPQLGFYAAYNYNRSENEVGFLRTNRAFGPSVGITMRWDILDQLSRYSGTKNAKLQLENAAFMQEQQEIVMDNELHKAFINFKWAEKNVQFELRNQLATSEMIQIAERAFELGAISPLELREIQFGIVTAKSRLLATQLDYITAQLNISLTVGDFKL